jgi:hypothetical protein
VAIKMGEDYIDDLAAVLKIIREKGWGKEMKAYAGDFKEYLKEEIKRKGVPEVSDGELILILTTILPEPTRNDLLNRGDAYIRGMRKALSVLYNP